MFFVFVCLGSRVVTDCNNLGNRTKCEPCPAGQFIDTINYAKNCRGCKSCKSNITSFFLSQSSTSPLCFQCFKNVMVGFFSLFFSFFASPELEDMVSKCERHQNTICRCKKGYYKFNIDSVLYDCRKCQSCDQDEIEKQKCTY